MGNGCSGGGKKSGSPMKMKDSKAFATKDIGVSSAECKVVILGNTFVGKTSIVLRYLENKFSETHIVTLGAVFQQPKIKLKSGNTLKVNLWDTAGEEKFRSMLPMYYKNAKGAILTYDISNRASFDSVQYWLSALNEHVKNENTVLALVGNKADIPDDERVVSSQEGARVAKANNMLFFEVSAKTGKSINELFSEVAEELVKQFKLM